MKIHDALILELIKPNKSGKPTGDIIKVVGTANIRYRLEQLVRHVRRVSSPSPSIFERLFGSDRPKMTIMEKMTPDIMVRRLKPASKEKEIVAIELETDVDFDFGESLRQIKKYRNRFPDVHVIIPAGKEYERFAPLYKNEGFRVWLWKAIRLWQCLRCGNMTEKEGPIQPKCKKCNRYTKLGLTGLKNAKFKEFV